MLVETETRLALARVQRGVPLKGRIGKGGEEEKGAIIRIDAGRVRTTAAHDALTFAIPMGARLEFPSDLQSYLRHVSESAPAGVLVGPPELEILRMAEGAMIGMGPFIASPAEITLPMPTGLGIVGLMGEQADALGEEIPELVVSAELEGLGMQEPLEFPEGGVGPSSISPIGTGFRPVRARKRPLEPVPTEHDEEVELSNTQMRERMRDPSATLRVGQPAEKLRRIENLAATRFLLNPIHWGEESMIEAARVPSNVVATAFNMVQERLQAQLGRNLATEVAAPTGRAERPASRELEIARMMGEEPVGAMPAVEGGPEIAPTAARLSLLSAAMEAGRPSLSASERSRLSLEMGGEPLPPEAQEPLELPEQREPAGEEAAPAPGAEKTSTELVRQLLEMGLTEAEGEGRAFYFSNVTEGVIRRHVCRGFLQTLILAQQGVVTVSQDAPYGEIHITRPQ